MTDVPGSATAPKNRDTEPPGLTEPIAHNFSAEPSSFVGREWELAKLVDALAETRVLTLTGAGGCGKSRLAARVGRAILPDFPDGAWWTEFAALSGREELSLAVAQVIGIRPGQDRSALDAVLAHLADRTALLVLDNCEHVLDEAARIAETVVRACPRVTVLVTSREPLRTDGETDWRVPSLSLPPQEQESGDARAVLDTSDAVRLFVERAAKVRPGFLLTADNAPFVARICRELDGIPLAIELAATRLRVLSVEQLAAALGERFRVLTGGTRTSVARHRALRASVDWSHDLLDMAERTLLRRLGVFRGGFTLDAARVCAEPGIAQDEVFELLAALVDKSLVQAEERDSVIRYRMLETLRQYALERLAEAGETEWMLDRHRDAFLDLAEQSEPRLRTPHQLEVLDLLDPEAPNFTQAIERAAATEPEKALRLCTALTTWWQGRGLFRQGEASCRTALEASEVSSLARARALWGRAMLLTLTGAFGEAVSATNAALEEARGIGDKQTEGRALWILGVLELFPAPAECHAHLERALELSEASGDSYAVAMCSMTVAYSYLHQSELWEAKPWYERALREAEATGQRDLIAWCRGAAAWAYCLLGRHDLCRDEAVKAIRMARAIGDVVSEMSPTCSLALVDIHAGEPELGLERLMAARRRTLALGTGFILPLVEVFTGWAYAAIGRLDEAQSWLADVLERSAGGYSYALIMGNVVFAEVFRLQGDTQRAGEAGRLALELAERNGDRFGCAHAQLTLGRLAAEHGECSEAQHLHHAALSAIVADDYRVLFPSALEALAEDMAGLGRPLDAARVLGAVEKLRAELGFVDWQPKRERLAKFSARLSEELGEQGYRSGLDEGAGLSAEEAVAFVRRARGARNRPQAGWESLTPTELDVARHVGGGLSNPRIAERMFITRGTVKGHLAHIYAKLGITNRAELAAEVTRRANETERGLIR